MKKFVLENDVPKCNKCSGVIKPDVVLFGEGLPSAFWKNFLDFPKCDLLIILGTSLVVQPFAGGIRETNVLHFYHYLTIY
jgi:NAD-dependent SIR2 family protein deacetylase